MVLNSLFKLRVDVNGYKNFNSNELSTQAKKGRVFEKIDKASELNSINPKRRIKIRLLEDGYVCWINSKDIDAKVIPQCSWTPKLLAHNEIKRRLPKVIEWVEKVAKSPNKYLWGGTIGPDFDCSGLMQAAYASQNIWIPRDAYQQEKFCKTILFSLNNLSELLPGDLLFFGSKQFCNHVGLYIGRSEYWHSSGISNGRNGIGKDSLSCNGQNSISSYYQSQIRSAGRIVSCHDGETLN